MLVNHTDGHIQSGANKYTHATTQNTRRYINAYRHFEDTFLSKVLNAHNHFTSLTSFSLLSAWQCVCENNKNNHQMQEWNTIY